MTPENALNDKGAPGASGPGDPGYEGDVTISEDDAGGDEPPAEAEADATEGEAPTG